MGGRRHKSDDSCKELLFSNDIERAGTIVRGSEDSHMEWLQEVGFSEKEMSEGGPEAT